MLKRKIVSILQDYLKSDSKSMLLVDGARQVGKSYIIRHVGQQMFANYIEINMEEDKQRGRLFANATSVEEFYLALSAVAGDKMQDRQSTLVFIDEIQAYSHLLTLTKFLMADNRYTYIASGSLLGVTLGQTQSVPVGSVTCVEMYPLDFEEFLWANKVGEEAISQMRTCFETRSPLAPAIHSRMMDLFRKYLLVGGLPDAVNAYLDEHNIHKVRTVQSNIHRLYMADAAKYEKSSLRKLKIQRIYDMMPSNLENRKKRLVVKDIEGKAGKRTESYQDEFDYLVSSGIALKVDAISKPSYPLVQNAGKNLLKLYMSDVGIFTQILYRDNIQPVLEDHRSVNLGAVYEVVVAQELKAHGYRLFYYDNKKMGEVDFLVDDPEGLSVIPIEVKSGRDYKLHSAIDRFLAIAEYRIRTAYVFSNSADIGTADGITYMPIYNIMFLSPDSGIEKMNLIF